MSLLDNKIEQTAHRVRALMITHYVIKTVNGYKTVMTKENPSKYESKISYLKGKVYISYPDGKEKEFKFEEKKAAKPAITIKKIRTKEDSKQEQEKDTDISKL